MPENYGGFGPARQSSIYLAGLSGKAPPVPVSPDALERAAERVLTPQAYHYVAGGRGENAPPARTSRSSTGGTSCPG